MIRRWPLRVLAGAGVTKVMLRGVWVIATDAQFLQKNRPDLQVLCAGTSPARQL